MIPSKERTKLRDLGEIILDESEAEETEVIIEHERDGVTRFANNGVTQNIDRSRVRFDIRVKSGSRKAEVSVTGRDIEMLREATSRAQHLLNVEGNRDEDAFSFLADQQYEEKDQPMTDSGPVSPEQRISCIQEAVRDVKEEGGQSFGKYASSVVHSHIMNSTGLRGSGRTCSNELDITVWRDAGTGWAEAASRNPDHLDPSACAKTAIEKAEGSRDSIDLNPGEVTVILEPAAVATVLTYLGFGAFGGREFVEDRSYLSGKMGENLFGEHITIVEDPFHDRMPSRPFDEDGYPKTTYTMVKDGTMQSVAHSRRTAKMADAEPNGSAESGFGGAGAYPSHMVLRPGSTTAEKMIEDTDRAVLVTQFHYCNFQDRAKMILTGMTRNGTFLVEEGRITESLQNLRFTQSIPEAFRNTAQLSSDLTFVPGRRGGSLVPTMKIDHFTFTGQTLF